MLKIIMGRAVLLFLMDTPPHLTTKDPTHAERTKLIGTGPDIQGTHTSKLGVEKNVFLSNVKKKQKIW